MRKKGRGSMKKRKKLVMERRRRRILSGVLAVLLVVALAVGLMPNKQVYAAEKTSDGNTTGSYAQNLGDNSSTRYAGRVWTDKTVYTEDATFSGDVGNVTVKNDSDFLVAYSALATTQNITGKSAVPVDVVFVIDNSNSMDEDLTWQQTRLQATVAAVNTSIATVMESHPESRVAVVVYGSSAHTLLPLGHYDPMPSGNYIAVDGSFTGNNRSYTEFSASESHTLLMQGADRGTNIHMGVDTGLDILKSATDIGEGASKHVPALILLSDGAATYSGSSNWWEPSGNEGNAIISAQGAITTINDGTFTGHMNAVSNMDNGGGCKLTVNGGTFTTDGASGSGAFYNGTGNTITIENCQASTSGESGSTLANRGTAIIHGGTFIGDNCSKQCYTVDSGQTSTPGASMELGENVVITGIFGALRAVSGSMTIKGGSYKVVDCDNHSGSDFYALYVASENRAVTVNIEDGTFESLSNDCVRVGNEGFDQAAVIR